VANKLAYLRIDQGLFDWFTICTATMKLIFLASWAVVVAACFSSCNNIKQTINANLATSGSFEKVSHFLHSFDDFDQLYHLLQERGHAVDLNAIYRLTCKAKMTEKRERELVDYSMRDPWRGQFLLSLDCASHSCVGHLLDVMGAKSVFTPNFQPQWIQDEDLVRILLTSSRNSNHWSSFSWVDRQPFDQINRVVSSSVWWGETPPTMLFRQLSESISQSEFLILAKCILKGSKSLHVMSADDLYSLHSAFSAFHSLLAMTIISLEYAKRFSSDDLFNAILNETQEFTNKEFSRLRTPEMQVINEMEVMMISKLITESRSIYMLPKIRQSLLDSKVSIYKISRFEMLVMTLRIQDAAEDMSEFEKVTRELIPTWNYSDLIPTALQDLLFHTAHRDVGLFQGLLAVLPEQIWTDFRFHYALYSEPLPYPEVRKDLQRTNMRRIFWICQRVCFRIWH